MALQYNPDRHRLSWTYVVTFELITIMFCDVSSGLEFRSVVMYFKYYNDERKQKLILKFIVFKIFEFIDGANRFS